MKLYTPLAFIIGLSLLGLLFLLATPYFATRIPTALERSTQTKLQENGINWARAEAAGRDINIAGTAPTAPDYQQALQLPETIGGVRNVINNMEQRVISPYTMSLEWNGEQLQIQGFVADESSQQQIQELLTQTYGDQATGQLQLAHGNPQGWHELITATLPTMKRLEHARIDITDQQLHIAGKTQSSIIREDVVQTLKEFEPQGYTLETHIVSSDDAIRICQQKFDTLLQAPISFASGKSTIQQESHTLLNELAATAALCPNNSITIAGHTDSDGDEVANLKLSQQRARAVAAWLFQEGISTERIRTVGYGERKPIASNTTEAGRAQNRRIEFIVQGK